MSIAVKDVLERILLQAAETELSATAVVLHTGGELVDGARNAALGVVPAQPRCADNFPSSFHFWAMGLRAFASARGRPSDSLEVADRCLCRSVDPDRRDPVIAQLLALARNPVPLELPDPVLAVFEMLADGNRRSLLIETQASYAALYWENDSAAPATEPLLRQLRVLAERDGVLVASDCVLVGGDGTGESLIAVQHDSDLRDPADATYAWRLGTGEPEVLDPARLGDCAALLFAMVRESQRIEIKSRLPGVSTPVRRFVVRGEAAAITLVEE